MAHNALAIALRHLDQLDEAEASGREALRIAPDYAEAHNTLGDTLAALGRFVEAEACCREALRLKPDYAEAYNNLGIVLISLGRPQEAEIACRAALRLKPGDKLALHNLSTALIALRRLGEAAACCREVLHLEPENAAAQRNLFTTLSLQQEISEAAAWLGRVAPLKSDFLSALLFSLAIVLSGNVRLAAGVVIAAGLAELGYIKLAGRRIEPVRWMSFALVLMLGGATILTQQARFVMLKPSVTHLMAAALMLRRGGMVRHITAIDAQRAESTGRRNTTGRNVATTG